MQIPVLAPYHLVDTRAGLGIPKANIDFVEAILAQADGLAKRATLVLLSNFPSDVKSSLTTTSSSSATSTIRPFSCLGRRMWHTVFDFSSPEQSGIQSNVEEQYHNTMKIPLQTLEDCDDALAKLGPAKTVIPWLFLDYGSSRARKDVQKKAIGLTFFVFFEHTEF